MESFIDLLLDTLRKETGFIFPIVLTSDNSEKQNYDSVQEIISSKPSSEKIIPEDAGIN